MLLAAFACAHLRRRRVFKYLMMWSTHFIFMWSTPIKNKSQYHNIHAKVRSTPLKSKTFFKGYRRLIVRSTPLSAIVIKALSRRSHLENAFKIIYLEGTISLRQGYCVSKQSQNNPMSRIKSIEI